MRDKLILQKIMLENDAYSHTQMNSDGNILTIYNDKSLA